MNQTWFIRMARWARNPPSWGRVKLVIGVVALCLAVFGYEKLFGWPDFLKVNPPIKIKLR